MSACSGSAPLTSTASTTTSNASVSSISVSPNNLSLLPGASLQLNASGGVAPYTFAVTTGGGTILANSGLYTAPGIVTTTEITATDSTGASGTGTVNVSFTALTLTPTVLTIAPNATFTFHASGGMPPFTYGIAYGGGTIKSNGLFTAPSTAGMTEVNVIDVNGSEVYANITVGTGTGTSTTPSGCSLISATAATSTTMTCGAGETLSTSALTGSCSGITQQGVASTPSYSVGCTAGATAMGSAYCCATRTEGSQYERTITGTGIQYLELFCGVGETAVSGTTTCALTGATPANYLSSGGGQEGYYSACTTPTATASMSVTCSGTVPF
jgi:large repetitive protein